GLEILAVNTTYQDQLGAARSFVAERGLSFPILLDRTGETANRYRMRALPTTFFVDREGVIRKVIVGGPMSEATLRSTVDSLLAEGEG
ncbi:MAG: TlpA disulfide reductase family protein, partial [Anaerolineales bacterium]|nr:TlpA disulfide reductase family protein [Anaerolineales bacterium]